jgi:hypothetical protein
VRDARSNKIAAALAGPGHAIAKAEELVPRQPGLYAIYGNQRVWAQLGLGRNPDGRPLYIGKAEDSLRDRDIRQHFADGRTGSSTVRRSFAALLRERLALRATPRNPLKPAYFANYGLSVEDDAKLTTWMRSNLTIAVWPSDGNGPLRSDEANQLGRSAPPLNLQGVFTDWSVQVSAARAVMAAEAKAWRPPRGKALAQ